MNDLRPTDLPGAIAAYQSILQKFSDNRSVAAKSQLHLGLCYERSGKVDAGKSAPDGDVSEPQPDAGRSPPAMADASAGPQRTDAKPSTQEPPPEGSSDPDMPTPRLAKSSGCSVGRANGAAGGVAAVLGLLAAALVLARRRRR